MKSDAMKDVFIASEAVRTGALTKGQLRWNYRPIFPDVHVARDAEPRLYERTLGAWSWSDRRGVVTGRAAAALHGARWVEEFAPIELIHTNCHPPPGCDHPTRAHRRRRNSRLRELEQLGWIVIRVIAEDSPTHTLDRVGEAFAFREREARAGKRSG
jgi:hypothetical protein